MTTDNNTPTRAATGRVWLITGASSGFGRAIAEAALAAGDTVVAAVRKPEVLDDLAAAYPDRAVAVQLDVTDPVRAAAVVAETILWYGRIDVLVNNAGLGLVGAVEETTDRELRDLMELHFFGPAALTRAVLPHLRRQGSGAIVQMSSMGGRFSFAGVGAYSATKFALEGLSEALAAEVAPYGIKVLIVEPGAFRTGFAGAARCGSPRPSPGTSRRSAQCGPTSRVATAPSPVTRPRRRRPSSPRSGPSRPRCGCRWATTPPTESSPTSTPPGRRRWPGNRSAVAPTTTSDPDDDA